MTLEQKEFFAREIQRLKVEKNAVILGHYYLVPELQDLSDFLGDSLALSQKAKETDAEMIVFCGVHFMAESAKILSPEKKVLIPEPEAGCSLATSCPPADFARFKEKYPGHTVISYINCTAEIKALSNIICTSSNAVGIVESLPRDEKIIFAPDKNLGGYINQLTGRNMVLWDGSCEVHDILTIERVLKLKNQYPEAEIIAHPECKAQILSLADFVGSTTALLKYTQTSESQSFIVATESGILHQMQKLNPEKTFHIVASDENCMCNDCPYMKMNTVEKLYDTLKNEKNEILLSESLIEKARAPIERMLDISAKLNI